MTLEVAVATRRAIDSGLLPPGPTRELDMAQSRHQAVLLVTTMQQRIEQVLSTSSLLALPNFFILMIESRTWGYFHPTLDGFDVRANPSTSRVERGRKRRSRFHSGDLAGCGRRNHRGPIAVRACAKGWPCFRRYSRGIEGPDPKSFFDGLSDRRVQRLRLHRSCLAFDLAMQVKGVALWEPFILDLYRISNQVILC
ncbi:MAG: hypothetical protein KGI75_16205 [Rhizobiaceae bacterium]|nr:hypothetical protein [Rhizobiaceae bacterium]